MPADHFASLVSELESRRGPSYLLLYPEEMDRGDTIRTIRQSFNQASVIEAEQQSITEIRPVGSGPHIVPLLDLSAATTPDESEDQALKSLCETSEIIFIAPDWFEICLNYPSRPRWTSRVEVIRSLDSASIEEVITRFPSSTPLLDRSQRRVMYRYLENRRFRRAVEAMSPETSERIKSEIERYSLNSLSSEVQDLLPKPNDSLFRSLAATKLQELGHLQLAEFYRIYGEGVTLNSVPEDSQFIISISDSLVDELPHPPFESTGIRVLFSLLFRQHETEKVLTETVHEWQSGNPSDWIEPADSGLQEYIVDRVDLLNNICSNTILRDFYRLLPILLFIRLIRHPPATTGVLEGVNRYRKIKSLEIKKLATKSLADGYRSNKYDDLQNVERIARFLEGDRPKVVLVVDSLNLMQQSTRDLVQRYQTDTPGYALAPPVSKTDTFVEELRQRVDFDTLGGYTDGEDLANTSIRELVNLDEKRAELTERLNTGESFIIYDPRLDVQARYEQSRDVEVNQYVRTIENFIKGYRGVADIMVTSDHGMVQVQPERSVSGIGGGTHERGLLTKEPNISRDDMIEVELGTDYKEDLLTPANPHSRIGSHNEPLWTHGGISVEESIVPCITVEN